MQTIPNVVIQWWNFSAIGPIIDFYKQVGYSKVHLVKPTDEILVAGEENQIIGVVRLVEESGVTVLCGMQILPEFQRRGIGSKMLGEVAQMLSSECYCIPYEHLIGFYGQIHFEPLLVRHAPKFLQERMAASRLKYAGRKQYLIMRRPASLC